MCFNMQRGFRLGLPKASFSILTCEFLIHLNRQDSRSTICRVRRQRVLPSRDPGSSQGRYAP